MRVAIVPADALGDDWRAKTHCPLGPDDVLNAKEAGWLAGARGVLVPTSDWASHGKPEILETFWDAYNAGRKAREEYLNA